MERLNKATKCMRVAFYKHKYYINLLNSPAEQRNQHVLYVSMWFNSLIRRQIFQDENLKKYCPSNSSDLFTAQAMVYMGLSAAQTTRSHAPKKDSY